jgi:endonuclease-3
MAAPRTTELQDGRMPQRRARAPVSDRKLQAKQVLKGLRTLYPDPKCALTHQNAFELLVATILSAQCTDARVNMVTPGLFQKYPDAHALATAQPVDVEAIIRSTGFFRAKTKNLIAMAKGLVEGYAGEVPTNLEGLTALAGVGRKTAHVVLGTAFGIPSGVVVDTHVTRLSFRLGLTDKKDPAKIERELAEIVPRKEWINLSHRLIQHGRGVCLAARPRCDACKLNPICPRNGVPTKAKPTTRTRATK